MRLGIHSLFVLSLLTSPTLSHGFHYSKGTFSIEPLILGLGNYTFGYENTDSQLNKIAINAFKAADGYVASEVEKFSIGYSAQLSYFLIDDLAFAFRISYIEDKPLGNQISLFPRAYQFNARKNWVYSLGLNQFMTIKNEKWLPFFGFTIGTLFQDNTHAIVYNIDADNHIIAPLGDAVLEPSQTRLKASLNVGADYQFSPRWVLSLTSGLSYLSRPARSHEIIFNLPTTYQDNNKSLTIPLTVSIKNVIA